MGGELFVLAWRSLANRRGTTILTVITIALSVALLFGVEKVRSGARASFANTLSGTDLIVGARTGPVQLLLYSVFRIGDATNNISWQSYQEIAARPEVAWTVPLSLGDSHRGFRVLGTTRDYFERFRYGRDRALQLAAGEPFADLFDVVLGAEVARRLGYSLGDAVVLAHGAGAVSLSSHADKPFRVSGVLARTGTPVDQTLHVSLEAIEAIHVDWVAGLPPVAGTEISAEEVRTLDLTPTSITAFFVGLTSRSAIFGAQRTVNTYTAEPLLAIIPGVALQSFWQSFAILETALRGISALVVGTGFLGMIAVSLASLGQRRREIAILRSVGARPIHVFALLAIEAIGLAAAGALAGTALVYIVLAAGGPAIEAEFGLAIPLLWPDTWEVAVLGLVLVAGCFASLIPAYRAYRMTLADGLMALT